MVRGRECLTSQNSPAFGNGLTTCRLKGVFELSLLEHTNCLQSLDIPGGHQVVPSEDEECSHDKDSWDEYPGVGSRCRQDDGKESQEQLWRNKHRAIQHLIVEHDG